MADAKQDLLGRLTDLSEGAVQRLSEAPGAERAVQAFKGLADRVDDLQRRTRGVEELEKRLTALEKRVDKMAKPKRKASRRPSASTTRRHTATSETPPKTP